MIHSMNNNVEDNSGQVLIFQLLFE